MGDYTPDSDRILAEARRVRDDNRSGGRHRLQHSIGRGSAELKAKHYAKKLVQMALGVVAVLVAAGVAGAILNGIGFWGVMLTLLAIGVVVGAVSMNKVKTPRRADINKGDVKTMVGRTELWLEAQRPALPPPAVKVVDGIGVQLDALGVQLEGLDQNTPQAVEVRKLVGEHLPEMVDSYRKVPQHLRSEKRADGKTPDEQLTDSLAKISKEIDGITRNLAEGNLDALSVRGRFLEYKYGDPASPVDGPVDSTVEGRD
ncbi:hypothetical protein QQS45_03050 [Alteriqipengyuania flavescens]|uniref:hypothetical protein n=1 Tax=Alteriqipengyuania flavescens TaxID=3053610 RepID=UPI0025B5252C|nr:hypothetical protein [Alteriqipengyuania flavescens]WJY19225.1 hypothetical protein QQW98_03045 [Alteriqipengyuania flavescens]WJY25166.1 hypothetical protein QQS45_03050 [Alteriqipengyuania flavescens]